MYDICIIGGGPAGMTAAIIAKRQSPSKKIVILEKNSKLGRKLEATGNGRCNISNSGCADIHISREFFKGVGIELKEEEQGRLYPNSEQGAAVVGALEMQIRSLGIEVFLERNIESVEVKNGQFELSYTHVGLAKNQRGVVRQEADISPIKSKKLLIAVGGKAGSQFGTIGDGFSWAKKLGHKVKKQAPILVPIVTKEDTSALKGVRAKAKVKLLKKGTIIGEEEGEVQFTEKGLSGICIFNLSRFMQLEEGEQYSKEAFEKFTFEVDLLPDRAYDIVFELLQNRRGVMGDLPIGSLLNTVVNGKISQYVFQNIELNKKRSAKNKEKELKILDISDCDLERISKKLKNLEFTSQGTLGWNQAQCTSGGVDFDEICNSTMESQKVKNLYFAGEILDFDGPCGGYNLENAWVTGIRAGIAMGDNS